MEEAFDRLSDMYSIEVQAMPPVLAHFAIPCCAERGGICSAAAARAFPRRRTIRSLIIRVSTPCAATLAPMSKDGVESSSLLDGPTCISQRPAGRRRRRSEPALRHFEGPLAQQESAQTLTASGIR
jgi:hypothetical protein